MIIDLATAAHLAAAAAPDTTADSESHTSPDVPTGTISHSAAHASALDVSAGTPLSSGHLEARSAEDRAQTIAVLRRRIATMGGDVAASMFTEGNAVRAIPTLAPAEQDTQQSSYEINPEAVIPVGSALAGVLTEGGIPRAAATVMSESPTMMVEMFAAATAAGSRVAFVGPACIHWSAVHAAGGDLSRMVVVNVDDIAPIPDATVWSVVAVLCEGCDLVVCMPSGAGGVSTAEARAVMARVRTSRCALIVTTDTWPSPALHLAATVQKYHGIRAGGGRLRGITLSVEARGRKQPPTRTQWTIGTPDPDIRPRRTALRVGKAPRRTSGGAGRTPTPLRPSLTGSARTSATTSPFVGQPMVQLASYKQHRESQS